MRIIRYGLVGGIGIPVNDLALLLFMSLMHSFYPLASACAFEVSTTINFVLNQLFTYSEQHLSGMGWVRRAGKAQLTSLSALLLSLPGRSGARQILPCQRLYCQSGWHYCRLRL